MKKLGNTMKKKNQSWINVSKRMKKGNKKFLSKNTSQGTVKRRQERVEENGKMKYERLLSPLNVELFRYVGGM